MMKRNLVIVTIMLAILLSFTIITGNGPVWAKEACRGPWYIPTLGGIGAKVIPHPWGQGNSPPPCHRGIVS